LDLINKGTVSPPNAIKIDVEGFEYEVLNGLGDYLRAVELRLIGIEVHFEILNNRGFEKAPILIEKMLTDSGFFVRWPDPSHIVAIRDR
jgi:hypothetical protein